MPSPASFHKDLEDFSVQVAEIGPLHEFITRWLVSQAAQKSRCQAREAGCEAVSEIMFSLRRHVGE